ncbi:MAG: hypothetical protein ACI9SI_001882 [Polaribacter sp.]|jgi:hypothetical protein
MKKITNRGLHRDIAYFYVGLLIAFSFSGIILNHRKDWYPKEYVIDSKEVNLTLPEDPKNITKDFIITAAKELDLTYESHRIRDGSLRVYFDGKAILDTDVKTGKGVLEFKKLVPFVGQSILLHQTTNSFWIWYSDIFGASILVLAFTGMFISAGENTFKKRGWKLAVAGLLFPVIFLLLFA